MSKTFTYTVEARGVIEQGIPQIIGVYSTKQHAYIGMKEMSRRSVLEYRLIEWTLDRGLFPGKVFKDVSTVLKDWSDPL